MPPKGHLKDGKCLVCRCDIPKCRMAKSVTCKKSCSRIYMRIQYYIKSNITGKFITENIKLKKRIKVMENAD